MAEAQAGTTRERMKMGLTNASPAKTAWPIRRPSPSAAGAGGWRRRLATSSTATWCLHAPPRQAGWAIGGPLASPRGRGGRARAVGDESNRHLVLARGCAVGAVTGPPVGPDDVRPGSRAAGDLPCEGVDPPYLVLLLV